VITMITMLIMVVHSLIAGRSSRGIQVEAVTAEEVWRLRLLEHG